MLVFRSNLLNAGYTVGAKTGQLVSLTEEIANSGEGKVWRTSRKGMLAKIYHIPDEERAKKLDLMVKHAPADPNAHKHHVSFAWPQSVLKDTQGKVVGFLMPEIVGGEQLVNVCNPSRRKRLGLEIDWRFLHVTARNVAALVQAIHKEGYVLGDIKLQNILVNNRALPSIIDVDSFQVKDPETGEVYHCPVGSEGFTPAELLDKDISTVTQEEVHDRFRLGVVIYQLLFGNHPFQGKWTGAGESPELNELIRKGFWPDSPTSLLQPSDRTIPLTVAAPELLQCFRKCFTLGHTNTFIRPTARDWVEALNIAFHNLKSCTKVESHFYCLSYKHCYWCERKQRLIIDIFDSQNINSKINELSKGNTSFGKTGILNNNQNSLNSQASSTETEIAEFRKITLIVGLVSSLGMSICIEIFTSLNDNYQFNLARIIGWIMVGTTWGLGCSQIFNYAYWIPNKSALLRVIHGFFGAFKGIFAAAGSAMFSIPLALLVMRIPIIIGIDIKPEISMPIAIKFMQFVMIAIVVFLTTENSLK